jgi:hypothetical protein
MTTTTPTDPDRSRLKNTVSMLAVVILLTVALAGRAQAVMYDFDEILSGLQEVPPNGSFGTGQIVGTYDDVTNEFDFSLTFSGLEFPTTAAHLHSPAPPGTNAPVQIAFAGFPTGVLSGFYANTYIFTAQQETDLLADLMYVNIHTSGYPGGEIRAQIFARPAGVPEQGGTCVLLGIGIAGLIAFARWSSSPRAIAAG